MTPALAFFYGGLVRSKNALNTMMMSFISLGFVGVLWAVVGYSLAFTAGNNYIGDLSRLFLRGVGLEAQGTIPHYLFMAYQGTFCIITAALISGAIVERMRFSAYLIFIVLWALFVYSPVAHWVWGGGWLADMGALDFAGGTVVHVNAGVAALVAAIVVGKRSDYPSSSLLPHNVPFTLARCGTALVRLVRLQRGQRARGEPDRSPCLRHDVPRADGHARGLDDPRLRTPGETDRGRCGHRDSGRPRRHYAGGRIRGTDERHRARRDRGDTELLRPGVAREDVARRLARRRGRARRGRHGRRAADRRVRAEGAERHSPTARCSAIPHKSAFRRRRLR